jgi:hypothetical protein
MKFAKSPSGTEIKRGVCASSGGRAGGGTSLAASENSFRQSLQRKNT